MAKQTIVVDDLDGARDNVQTHTFSLDDNRYEIDLSSPNFAHLVEALEPFVRVARPRSGRVRGRGPSKRAREAVSREIRAWAEENGMEVSARGAFPKEVVAAYWKAKEEHG